MHRVRLNTYEAFCRYEQQVTPLLEQLFAQRNFAGQRSVTTDLFDEITKTLTMVTDEEFCLKDYPCDYPGNLFPARFCHDFLDACYYQFQTIFEGLYQHLCAQRQDQHPNRDIVHELTQLTISQIPDILNLIEQSIQRLLPIDKHTIFDIDVVRENSHFDISVNLKLSDAIYSSSYEPNDQIL